MANCSFADNSGGKVREPGQKSSCINGKFAAAFEVMTDLKYSAFSIRAAEVFGPTVTAIRASRRAASPEAIAWEHAF